MRRTDVACRPPLERSGRSAVAVPAPRSGGLAHLLSSLASLARQSCSLTELNEILELSAERIRHGVSAATVSLSRLEPGTGVLRTLINVGELGPGEQRWPEDETYSLQNFLKLRGIVHDYQTWTVVLGDPAADPAELNLLAELEKEAAIAAPILVEGNLWGELYMTFSRREDLLADEEYPFLEVYLALLEGTLTRLRQIHTLEQLAYRDPMTGLANRRALDDAAARCFASMEEGRMSRVSVAAFDLNGLKQVNDRHGHPAGDRFISGAAAAIRDNFNRLPGNLAARVGGDEFVILVPEYELSDVQESAAASVADIARLQVGAGASCGLATATGGSPSGLFARADSALYDSKRAGQLVVAA